MDFGILIATLLAISLAAERIVAIVKTMSPGWFAEPAAAVPGAPAPTLAQDRGRRLRVQAVAFAACWVAAASLNPGFDFVGPFVRGGLSLPTPLVGLLAMGGSAFWTQVLGISGALKDLKTTQANDARVASADRAKSHPEEKPAPEGTVHLPNTTIAKSGAGA